MKNVVGKRIIIFTQHGEKLWLINCVGWHSYCECIYSFNKLLFIGMIILCCAGAGRPPTRCIMLLKPGMTTTRWNTLLSKSMQENFSFPWRPLRWSVYQKRSQRTNTFFWLFTPNSVLDSENMVIWWRSIKL